MSRETIKTSLIRGALYGGVAGGWLTLGHFAADLAIGQFLVADFALVALTQALLIPRWPKSELLKSVLWSLKPGERVEVEGRR